MTTTEVIQFYKPWVKLLFTNNSYLQELDLTLNEKQGSGAVMGWGHFTASRTVQPVVIDYTMNSTSCRKRVLEDNVKPKAKAELRVNLSEGQ